LFWLPVNSLALPQHYPRSMSYVIGPDTVGPATVYAAPA
jgi:hypothetical protein